MFSLHIVKCFLHFQHLFKRTLTLHDTYYYGINKDKMQKQMKRAFCHQPNMKKKLQVCIPGDKKLQILYGISFL